MDNLARKDVFANMINKGTLRQPLPADTKLQMVSCQDIGRLAARIFLESQEFKQDSMRSIDLAMEDMTMRAYAQEIGLKYEQIPADGLPKDYQLMFEWFEKDGYHADVSRSRSLVKVCRVQHHHHYQTVASTTH